MISILLRLPFWNALYRFKAQKGKTSKDHFQIKKELSISQRLIKEKQLVVFIVLPQ